MAQIAHHLKAGTPAFSFEFFPPKDEAGRDLLFKTVSELRPYKPAYVSVTYGAGGSTRHLTIELVERIQRETGIDAMAHLTCVGSSREDISETLIKLKQAGVQNILALRGDPPQGSERFERPEGGFAYANELISWVKAEGDFCVAAACYPEKHPEAASLELDLQNLKRKVDAGAQLLVTQLFFDASVYFNFVEKCRGLGIELPIIAGIMPITNVAQVTRFTQMCGTTIPADLMRHLGAASGPAEVRKVGVEYAVQQCERLIRGGAPGLHFYTLNRSPATVQILDALRGGAPSDSA